MFPPPAFWTPCSNTIALAENACANGVCFRFGHKVERISRLEDGWMLHTSKGDVKTKWVITAPACTPPKFPPCWDIRSIRSGALKASIMFWIKRPERTCPSPSTQPPTRRAAFATHATPTIDGNVLVGPDSYLTEGLEDYKVTKEHMDGLYTDGLKMFKEMKREYFIRNFAGIRWKIYDPATGENKDFVLESDGANPFTVNLVGIESPGLTCALPLARRAVSILKEKENPAPNPAFNPCRRGIRRFSEMTREEQAAAVAENPDYGEIVCRCETVTRAEILQAIHNPLGVHTVTGIKNRTRATMGRCQGGYCETRITQMIEEELSIPETEVRYSKAGSYMFTGKVR